MVGGDSKEWFEHLTKRREFEFLGWTSEGRKISREIC